ncbi:hypothetical protein ABZT51_07480 [Streptomyces sp. NPDC005373]|uniref:hypothetical protein n=1 Tax=Streptomyces sp. NPDC005373 TaxID=3156879 RepID=UPI0033B5F663
MTIGTAIGAVGAIGGLLFTGIATYYSAVIARQQLDQSRVDSEMEARGQAERVTYWMAEGSNMTRAVHLVNRSPDAVTDVGMYFGTTYKGGEYELQLPDVSLPPCTEAIYRSAEMGALITRNAIGEVHLSNFTWWEVDTLAFTDRTGQRWVRTPTFLKRPEEALRALPEPRTDGLVLVSEPTKVKTLESCGSDK